MGDVFRDLYDFSPDMQVSVDAASGRIVECNHTLVETLGYRRQEILGKPVLELYHPDSLARAQRCLETFRATGTAGADHLQLMTAQGEPLDVSLRATAVRDRDGRILRSNSIWRDIRTQVRTERELRASRTRYRNLVESAPVCIHEVDPDGRLIDMNPAGMTMIGETDPSAIRGVRYLDFVRPADRPRIEDAMRRAFAGEAVDFEFVSDTTPAREFRSGFVPIPDPEGRVVRLMGVTQDLTEQRANERALRQKHKMEAVGRLAGGIAHDFNNLLTVILGYCEELRHSLPPESRESRNVSQVSQAADQAAILTKQLLAFSRSQERRPVVLQLNDVIAGQEKMLSRLLGEGIALETRLAADLGPIEADAGQIEQILVNLAANARDAMPTGGTLRIETLGAAGGARARLQVSDTGKGIEPEVLERIFEPFYTTKETGRGSGLGLATVFGIVERNAGEIRIDSDPGRGTRVSIDFPVADREIPPDAAESGDAPCAVAGSETVLLVEDREPIRRLIVRALQEQGYAVLEAENGVDALRVAGGHEGAIDILVTDVVMPQMGGAHLAARLRERIPKIKVVFMSGYLGGGEHGELPDDAIVVAKPCVPSELVLTVRQVLDGVRLSA